MKNYFKYIGIGFVLFLIIAQFFPIDKTNPPADMSIDFIEMTNPNVQIGDHIKIACYDCHSHHTKYPWYTDIAPVSWWIKGHMNNGLKHLNFSVWGNYSQEKKNHKLDECVDFVDKNWMPLLTYKIAHPESKLTDEERENLIVFFKSLKSDG